MSTPNTPNTPHDSPTSDEPEHPSSQLGQFSPSTVIADAAPFVVAEPAEGRDLRSILEEEGDLPIERAVDLTLQVCEALAAAHAGKVIVRDITPENLFVTNAVDGEYVKLIDSGFSELDFTQQQITSRKTRTSNVGLGTLAYMSPEQVRASNRLDVQSDQWSLGCVLYELLTGVSPFERMSPMQTCAAILEDEPVLLRECCPGAFPELEEILTRCLRKDPNDRYADIAELALAIAPFGARSVGSAPRCVELLAAAEDRSRPGNPRSDSPPKATVLQSASVPTVSAPRVLVRASPTPDPQQPVEREGSDFIALTEADLVEGEEVFSVQPTKSRKQRLVLLGLGALTALSAAYLAARGWDAAHSQSVPAPITHQPYDSPDLRAVPVANDGAPERLPTPTAAPAKAKRSSEPVAPAATFKPSMPASKRRPVGASAEEPDVGF